MSAMSSSSPPRGAPEAPPQPRAPVQQRLHEGFQADRRVLSQLALQTRDQRSARVEAVLELKQDLDASSALIEAQNAVRRAREQATQAQDARSHQDLLRQGQNPYEVVRRRTVKQEAQRERSRLERRLQSREAKLLGRLEVEKSSQRRRERLEAENRAFERKYQREMGRAAVEERTHAYLISRTGRETLDPTGKLVRIYPSQETTLKDQSFGLGRSAVQTLEHRERVINKVLAKPSHRGTEPSSMLLPRNPVTSLQKGLQHSARPETELATSSRRSEEGLTLPSLPSKPAGQGSRAVLQSPSSSGTKLPPVTGFREQQDAREEDEDPGPAASELPSAGLKHKKSRVRSVLEERQLLQARQRQQDARFTQLQVVWGKPFSGSAFLADPAELWFQDFDVNRPLTLSFTLTNVSNTFNQFRLLPMADEVRELFDVNYTKPGRMSAGMSCALRMTFTASEACDLATTLTVASPTGLVNVPVRCTCKKAVPVLSQQQLRFAEVVAGERATIAVTLANHGALPLPFSIHPLSTEAAASSPQIDDNPEENEVEEAVEDAEDPTEVTTEAEPEPNEAEIASPEIPAPSSHSEPVETQVVEAEEDLEAEQERVLIQQALESMQYKPEGADKPIRFTKQGVVPPYSSSIVAFTFAPASAMTLENQPFLVEFPSDSSSPSSLPSVPGLPVLVSAVASQVPVFLAHDRLDFRCCVYEKLYRHQLLVCNRGKVALKLQLQVPKALKNCLEFSPSFGFVQAATATQPGQFPIHLKFRPKESMWPRLERSGLGSRDLGILAVPIQILVPDQVVPVFCLLTARLTPSVLKFQLDGDLEAQNLDFGACCIGQSVGLELRITNSARVPQRVGLTRVPEAVTVADGVGLVLLPGETRKLQVVYTPRVTGPLTATSGASETLKPLLIVWSSTYNQEYTLPCSGTGVSSALTLSQSVVRLGATALGQTQSCNVRLRNRSDRQTLGVELLLPPEAAGYLRVTPLVTRLEPRQSVRLEIAFEPTEDLFQLLETCQFEASTPPQDVAVTGASATSILAESSLAEAVPPLEALEVDGADPRSPWKTGIDSEPRSCHHKWTVLCFQRVESTGSTLSTVKPAPLQALEIHTTVVEPAVHPSPASLAFGPVAIGQTLIRELTLASTAAETDSVKLQAQPLHVLGAFRLLGSLREVPGGGHRRLRIEFEPREPLVYEDELELTAPGVKLRVQLSGAGIPSCLSLTPIDGRLDFQDVLARTRSVQELLVANGSAFPLAFSIVNEEESDGSTTSTGLPVFSFSPSEATIPAEGVMKVLVAFQPDHQRPGHYTQRFRLKVPNESERHTLDLSGRCWENQVYVFAPTATTASSTSGRSLVAPPPVEDLFDLPPSVALSQLTGDLSTAGFRKPPVTLTLSFPGFDEGGGDSQTLFVGSTAPCGGSSGVLDDVSGSSGSFEFAVDATSPHAKLFTLEPMRGTVAAGQQLSVQVAYQPPVAAAATDSSHDEAVAKALAAFAPTRVFRKDLLTYCTLRNLLPHPQLLPLHADEEERQGAATGEAPATGHVYDVSDVEELAVKHWQLDVGNSQALCFVLPLSVKVHSLCLFNVGLDLEQLELLCSTVPKTHVTSFQLEWNQLETADGSEVFAQLLSEDSKLVVLSLRANGISSRGAEALARALRSNSTLEALNLFQNRVDDAGARAFAYALPFNTTLKTLSLANNQLSGIGAKLLVEGLTQYEAPPELLAEFEAAESVVQAQLDQAKKAKKKLDHASVIAQLGLPVLETVDGVVYAPGNATLEELVLSGNALLESSDLGVLSEVLGRFRSKLANHLRCIKLQRLPKTGGDQQQRLSDFIKL
ncbi:hypothetical protein BBJ28_00012022 [Nothophytophthora sp. Chile5]|nr:hypothetical protein BBJ28_00012022 [Nothophytophthora sp. Chile5]